MPNTLILIGQIKTNHEEGLDSRRGGHSAITSGGSHRACSRIGFHPSDLLGFLGIDGIHTDWRDRRGYGADPSFPACALFDLVWCKTDSSPERCGGGRAGECIMQSIVDNWTQFAVPGREM